MFGSCCELRVGVQRSQGSSHLRIGATGPDDPVSEDFDFGQYFLRFSFDKLDSVFFPRHGELLTFEWNGTRETLGSARDNDRMEFNWLVARSLGRNTLIASLAGGTTLAGQPAVQDLFSLGGFLNLSGITRDAITGPHYGMARLVYLRKLGAGGEGFLNVPLYVGVSLEAGNVWMERRDMSFGSARKDGAIFMGLDTLLGPVYLGAGFDEEGTSAYYLFLGRSF
jgi:NTE family protein